MASEQLETEPPVSKKAFVTTTEIEKHISKDDLWMVINGKVYDITPFVDEHPYVFFPGLFFPLLYDANL